MLKRCSPFYQEVSALEYCYWYFSSHMYLFTFSGKDRSLPRQKSYKKKKKKGCEKLPSLLHVKVPTADWWGAPVTSLTSSRSSWHAWAPGPLCFPVYFWKLKWGHGCQAQVSHWRQKERISKLGLSQNPGEGGLLSSACLVSGFCTQYDSAMCQHGAAFPLSCPPGPESLLSLPPFYFCHELVS